MVSQQEVKKMARFSSGSIGNAVSHTNQVPNHAYDRDEPMDFRRLPGDEIERLIASCRAPASLWCHDHAPARTAEPFGMIA
jgi:hypothetical protein